MKIRTIPMLICFVVLGAICLAGQPMGVAPTPLSAPESLQVVIDRGGPLVYVPKGHYTLEATLRLRSDLALHFESGTVIEAAAGAMKGMEDCLIAARGVQKVSIYAHGATFRIRKTDYRDEKNYEVSFVTCWACSGARMSRFTEGSTKRAAATAFMSARWWVPHESPVNGY